MEASLMKLGKHQKLIQTAQEMPPNSSLLVPWPYKHSPSKVIKAGLSLHDIKIRITCQRIFGDLFKVNIL